MARADFRSMGRGARTPAGAGRERLDSQLGLRERSLQRQAMLHLLVGRLLVVAHALDRRDAHARVDGRVGEERPERVYLLPPGGLLRIAGGEWRGGARPPPADAPTGVS